MKSKIFKCVLGGMLPAILLCACNSSKDVERTPDDHETVMNTTPTNTTPVGKDSVTHDSVRFPPPVNPDTSHFPPKK